MFLILVIMFQNLVEPAVMYSSLQLNRQAGINIDICPLQSLAIIKGFLLIALIITRGEIYLVTTYDSFLAVADLIEHFGLIQCPEPDIAAFRIETP